MLTTASSVECTYKLCTRNSPLICRKTIGFNCVQVERRSPVPGSKNSMLHKRVRTQLDWKSQDERH